MISNENNVNIEPSVGDLFVHFELKTLRCARCGNVLHVSMGYKEILMNKELKCWCGDNYLDAVDIRQAKRLNAYAMWCNLKLVMHHPIKYIGFYFSNKFGGG